MAVNTDPRLQNQVIYSVYVRAHTPEGTFRAVIPDLDRIKALGTDIIWFLPIHPIGETNRRVKKAASAARMPTAITVLSIPPMARWTISRRSWARSTSAA